MLPAVQQKSFTVRGVSRCCQISCVTPNLVWVNDGFDSKKLILSDETGNPLHEMSDACPFLGGSHAVNKNCDLIYLDCKIAISKLTSNSKEKTTIVRGANPTSVFNYFPFALCCSASSTDILVGLAVLIGDHSYKDDEGEMTISGKVNRYSISGQLMQTIQFYNNDKPLYALPMYIAENNNEDVVVSDSKKLVVTDRDGELRFFYEGHSIGNTEGHSIGATLFSRGICTDAFSNILVCDGYTHTVQMIDKDGQFLSYLIKGSPSVDPQCLSYDVSTNLLWVGYNKTNSISVYKYISGRSI